LKRIRKLEAELARLTGTEVPTDIDALPDPLEPKGESISSEEREDLLKQIEEKEEQARVLQEELKEKENADVEAQQTLERNKLEYQKSVTEKDKEITELNLKISTNNQALEEEREISKSK